MYYINITMLAGLPSNFGNENLGIKCNEKFENSIRQSILLLTRIKKSIYVYDELDVSQGYLQNLPSQN